MPSSPHLRRISLVATGALLLILVISSIAQAQTTPGPTSPELRLQWYQQHVAMQDQSLLKNLPWRFIGPEIMSGRLTDVAIPPNAKHTVYLAAASGGIWKTINEGTTWEPVFEHGPSTSIGDIAIAPSNPDIVWAGLGEANIFRSSYSGTGVYKSIDAGKTWTHMGLTDTQHIARIVIDPRNPDVVYVAASGHEYTDNEARGIYKSTDGGKSWSKILFISSHTGAIDLVMDPADNQTLYAATWERIRRPWSDPLPGPESGIYKTTDGGKTWQRKTEGLPPKETTGRIGLSVSLTHPNIIYAVIDNHQAARAAKEGERDSYGNVREKVIRGAEVYRSDDRGETWRKVSESSRLLESMFSTYGWVFGQIRVDPNDENTVYIMGIPLMKSTDGGKTFKPLYFRGLHGDHHALWIDPNDSNHLVNGNDGGLNISYDGGATWINYEAPGIVQFYNVAVDTAEPFNVYGSIQDNGTFMGPVTHRPGRDPNTDWKSIPGGEASYVAVDPVEPNIVYSESFYGRIQRSDLSGRHPKTVSITPKAGKGEPPLRGNWLAPFIISPHNRFIIYHGMQYLFRSLDRGDHWERISPDLTYNDPDKHGNIPYATLTTISESPLKFGLIYVGTDDGKVQVTRDGGEHWTEIMAGLPLHRWVSRVEASAFDEGTVYLSLNGYRNDDFTAYIYKSTDYGQNWQSITGNIPCGPVNVIREDPKNANILYVGTDLGVYVSLDGGVQWQVMPKGIPTTFVHDLVVHPRDNILVAATHGRGMFVADVSWVQKLNHDIMAKPAHLFTVDAARLPSSTRRWALESARPAQIAYYLHTAAPVELSIRDAEGNTIITLPATGDAGLNFATWNLTLGKTPPAGDFFAAVKLAKPGTYTIVLKAGDQTLTTPLELKAGSRMRFEEEEDIM